MPPASLPAAAEITPGPRTESKTSQRDRRLGAEAGLGVLEADPDEAGGGDAAADMVASGDPSASRMSRGSGMGVIHRRAAPGSRLIRTIVAGTMTVHGIDFSDAGNDQQEDDIINPDAPSNCSPKTNVLSTARLGITWGYQCIWAYSAV
ncbi:hypothetical protein CCAX7_37350 [Capsulimonas corticalis]|uniref:Uncharacterized protein n=1 Tax=Capsulimonas corticalis TaxID=2219043 RepID=A0A402D136_9BACT|nr:hypothetical protein CCAX7_37350 [Capsulimonas corticalis]